jgi:hypothetical protein
MTATAARATCASFSHCVRAAESRKSPQNSDFYGHRTTYSEKAHCIKDSVLLDQTCGSGGFFYKGYNFVELYNPSADVLLFVRASNAEIYAMRLSYVAL